VISGFCWCKWDLQSSGI